MSYKNMTIKEAVERIGRNDMYLPAIQRKFVWHHSQIEDLFDSIMRDYPIGTFLFWCLTGKKANDYTFYKFLQEYHERRPYNDLAPRPITRDQVIGVLDGQQRLSSMYIALQGTYAYKKRYGRWDNDDSFPPRQLYLNAFADPAGSADEDGGGRFKFLTDDESREADERHLWFPVKTTLLWPDYADIDRYCDELLGSNDLPDSAKTALRERRVAVRQNIGILHQRLVRDERISYFEVTDPDLDSILDIFVRVNSGGTVLSKSDLLFSTIIAHWQSGRQEIEEFIKSINKEGDGFRFNTDFVMRTCLVLTDCPVLFKVKGFNPENISIIQASWDQIKTAIRSAVRLLVEWGFSGETLTSQNAIIPIAYHLAKNGSTSDSSKTAMRRYLIHSLLKGIYGGQGDRVLSAMRDTLRQKTAAGYVLQNNAFSFENICEAKLSGGKRLKMDQADLDEILEYRKGSYSFMVLSMLYPWLKFEQETFHQDHIHPDSGFSDARLQRQGIPEAEWAKWRELKDALPNLQLMLGRENSSKNKTPFVDWLHGCDQSGQPNVPDVDDFKRRNCIPGEAKLDFPSFAEFFEARRQLLRERIEGVLL